MEQLENLGTKSISDMTTTKVIKIFCQGLRFLMRENLYEKF